MQDYTQYDISLMRKEDEENLKKSLPDNADRKLLISMRYDLSPDQFEEFVARWYKKQGRKTRVQGGYNDEGIDIVATKGEKTAFIQCKKRCKGRIALKDIAYFYGLVRERDPHAQLIYITTTWITPNAKKFARQKNIDIYDYNKLIQSLKGHKAQEYIDSLDHSLSNIVVSDEFDTEKPLPTGSEKKTTIMSRYDNVLEKLTVELQILDKTLVEEEIGYHDVAQSVHFFQLEYQSKLGNRFIIKSELELKIKKHHGKYSTIQDILNEYDYEINDSITDESYEKYRDDFEKTKEKSEQVMKKANMLSPEELDQLKTLFRQLVKKFHPDRCDKDPASQEKATKIFHLINTAYEEKDLKALQEIEAKYMYESLDDISIADEKQQTMYDILIRRKEAIEQAILDIHTKKIKLMQSSIWSLYQKYLDMKNKNEDLFGYMIAEIREEIDYLHDIIKVLP